MKKKLLAAGILVCLQTGCATTNNPTAQDQVRDEVLVTGSRIPQRTSGTAPVSQSDKEGWEDSTRGHKQVNPQGR